MASLTILSKLHYMSPSVPVASLLSTYQTMYNVTLQCKRESEKRPTYVRCKEYKMSLETMLSSISNQN